MPEHQRGAGSCCHCRPAVRHEAGNASAAFHWYLAAAQRGSATGQFLMGLAYSNGATWQWQDLQVVVQ